MRRLFSVVLGASLLLLAAVPPAPAQREGAHALVGARLVPRPGSEPAPATLIVRDGLIEAIGPEAEPPGDARVWSRDGLTIYPGLIEPYSVRSSPVAAQDAGRSTATSVRPERDPAEWPFDSEKTESLRAAGFTTAVVAPAEGIFRGWGALINLGGGDPGDNLLRRRIGQFVSLRWNSFGEAYPTSRMGATALVRQTLLDSQWHRRAWAEYSARPAQPRPPTRESWSELEPAALAEVPIFFETRAALDGLRFERLAREVGVEAVLVGSGDEYRRLAELAATGLPYILPLDFASRPVVPEADDLSIRLETLRHWDLAPDNPRRMVEAGVVVAFTSHRMDQPRKIFRALAAAVERGLTPAQALGALTTVPAELLGISDRAGTLDPGKMANFIVVDGSLLVEEPRLVEVWIDGVRYPVDVEADSGPGGSASEARP